MFLAAFASLRHAPSRIYYDRKRSQASATTRLFSASRAAKLRQTIKGWLKAGVLGDGTSQPTERGSPQGGVVSPLLALVAMHGLETVITTAFRNDDRPHVAVYADDFVVLHPTRAGVERARQIAEG